MFRLNSPRLLLLHRHRRRRTVRRNQAGRHPRDRNRRRQRRNRRSTCRSRAAPSATSSALLFVAPLPPSTPVRRPDRRPAAGHRPLRDHRARSRAAAGNTNATRSGRTNNAKLMPQLPSGHVDRIDVTVVRNPSTQVNDVEQGSYDWMQNPPPADRYAAVKRQVRGHPVPGRAADQHLLLLDEHQQGAVRRPEGAPGGQLRRRPAKRWNGSTPARSPPPSRSCRRGCPATAASTSTRTTWPRRSN